MAAEAVFGVEIAAASSPSAAFAIPRSPSPCNVPIATVSVDTAAPSASANLPTAKDAVVFTAAAASGAASGAASAGCSSNGVESFSSGTEVLGVVEEEDGGLLLGLIFFSFFFFFATTAVARVVAARRYQMIKSSNVTRAESSGDKS